MHKHRVKIGAPSILRLSPTIITQNARPICSLDSITGKRFHNYFLFSLTIRPKIQHSLQIDLEQRGYLNLGYTSFDTQNGSSI